MRRIEVEYTPSSHKIDVLTNNLDIHYTIEYVKQLVPSISDMEARKTLNIIARDYDEDQGVTRSLICLTAKGVQSGLAL